MPKTSSKKTRKGNTPPKLKIGRWGKAAIEQHLTRFDKMHFDSGGELTQEKYAADHGIAAGTFSRWMSERKKSGGETVTRLGVSAPYGKAGNGSAGVKGLLPVAPEDGNTQLLKLHDAELQKKHEKELGKNAALIAELEAKVERLTQANAELESSMTSLQQRNEELKTGLKAVVGQL